MSRQIYSPLGDLAIQRLETAHWGVAAAAALALHALGAFAYVNWTPENPFDASEEETMIGVDLGPPGGRLDPNPPPPPEAAAPSPPSEPAALTERSDQAPPIEYTAPLPPAPPGSRLSSGFGPGGGDGAPQAEERAPEPTLQREDYDAYVRQAVTRIHESIVYPYRALQGRNEGVATLRLRIHRDGRLMQHGLVRGTGTPVLDEAIDRAVRDVNRFPRLPREYPRDAITIVVTVRFLIVYSDAEERAFRAQADQPTNQGGSGNE